MSVCFMEINNNQRLHLTYAFFIVRPLLILTKLDQNSDEQMYDDKNFYVETDFACGSIVI